MEASRSCPYEHTHINFKNSDNIKPVCQNDESKSSVFTKFVDKSEYEVPPNNAVICKTNGPNPSASAVYRKRYAYSSERPPNFRPLTVEPSGYRGIRPSLTPPERDPPLQSSTSNIMENGPAIPLFELESHPSRQTDHGGLRASLSMGDLAMNPSSKRAFDDFHSFHRLLTKHKHNAEAMGFEFERLQFDEQEIQSRLAQLSQTESLQVDTIHGLKSIISGLYADIESLRCAHSRAIDHELDLQEEVSSLKRSRDWFKDQSDSAQASRDRVESELERLRTSLNGSTTVNHQLTHESARLQAQLACSRASLAEAKRVMSHQLESIRVDMIEREVIFERILNERSELERLLMDRSNQVGQLQSVIQKLEHELNEASGELQKQIQQTHDLQTDLTQLDEKKTELQKKLTLIEDEHQQNLQYWSEREVQFMDTANRLSMLESKCEESDQRSTTLWEENVSLNASLLSAQKEKEMLDIYLTTLKENSSRIEQTFDKLRSELELKSSSISNLTIERDDLIIQLQATQMQLNEALQFIDTLKQDKQNLHITVTELREELTRTQHHLDLTIRSVPTQPLIDGEICGQKSDKESLITVGTQTTPMLPLEITSLGLIDKYKYEQQYVDDTMTIPQNDPAETKLLVPVQHSGPNHVIIRLDDAVSSLSTQVDGIQSTSPQLMNTTTQPVSPILIEETFDGASFDQLNTAHSQNKETCTTKQTPKNPLSAYFQFDVQDSVDEFCESSEKSYLDVQPPQSEPTKNASSYLVCRSSDSTWLGTSLSSAATQTEFDLKAQEVYIEDVHNRTRMLEDENAKLQILLHKSMQELNLRDAQLEAHRLEVERQLSIAHSEAINRQNAVQARAEQLFELEQCRNRIVELERQLKSNEMEMESLRNETIHLGENREYYVSQHVDEVNSLKNIIKTTTEHLTIMANSLKLEQQEKLDCQTELAHLKGGLRAVLERFRLFDRLQMPDEDGRPSSDTVMDSLSAIGLSVNDLSGLLGQSALMPLSHSKPIDELQRCFDNLQHEINQLETDVVNHAMAVHDYAPSHPQFI